MKKFVPYLILAYVSLSIQAIFFKGVRPDFVLVLVCFYSLKYGQIKGATYGALTGLMIDTASGFILGPNIISKSLAGFFIRTVRENIFQWNVFIGTLVIAIFSVVDIFLVYICLETFSTVSFINRPWDISIMQVIYTSVAALILYVFLNPEKDSKVNSRV